MSTTLGRLLQRLGPAALEVIATPKGVDVAVSEPALLDLADVLTIHADQILLAVGVRGSSPAIEDVIATAGKQGASAVVIKDPGTGLARLAEEAGVAILAADPEMPWRQLDSLITSAVEHPDTESDRLNENGMGAVGDLFALANAVAAMVGGAVSIEDPQRRVLAYSNLEHQPIDEVRQRGILGRRVPDYPGMVALYGELSKSEGVFHFESPDLGARHRIGVAVRAAGEVLGSIWVVEGELPFGPEAEEALADAGRIAALHMLRARNAQDVARRDRAEMVAALLEGHRSAGVAARRVGLESADRVHIVGFAIVEANDADEAGTGAIADRVVDLITIYCEAFRRKAACAAIGPVIYALLPSQDGERRLDALAKDVVTRAMKSLGVRVLAAVSNEPVKVDGLPGLRSEIDRALAVLATDAQQRQVVTVDDVRDQSTLLEIGRILSQRPDLESGALKAMRTLDEQKGTAHVATMKAYFDALGDVIEAADRISVHQNTFRYRLRRVGEIFNIDLNDPDTRLLLWLQLRTLD